MLRRLCFTALGLAALTVAAALYASEPRQSQDTKADKKNDAKEIKDLAVKEKILQARYAKFEADLQSLQERWSRGSEMERISAARLKLALDKSTGATLTERYAKYVRFLATVKTQNDTQLNQLIEQSNALGRDLTEVLAILKGMRDPYSSNRKKILTLEEQIKELNNLIREQKIVNGQIEIGLDNKDVKANQSQVAQATREFSKKLEAADKIEKGGDKKGEGDEAKKNDKSEAKKGEGGDKGQGKNQGKQDKGGEAKPGDAKNAGDKKKESDKQGSLKTKDEKKTNPDNPKAGEKKEGSAKSGDPKSDKQGSPKNADAKSGEKSESKSGEPSKNSPGEAKSGKSSPSQGSPKSGGEPKDDTASSKKDSPKKDDDANPKGPKRNIDDAAEKMDNVKNNIEKDVKKATEDGKKAEDDLKLARQKLEELLRQLREEEQAQLLAALIQRCKEMLRMQEAVLQGTEAVARAIDNNSGKKANRANIQDSLNLSDDEKKIVAKATEAIDLLEAEGSAIAFPEVFQQVREDMKHVVRRLAATPVDPGKVTQAIEQDIIDTFKDMVKALEAIKNNLGKKPPPPPGGGPPPQVDPKLLKKIEELKMVRAMQMRVNNRTILYGKEYPGEQADDAVIRRELRNLSDRQERIFGVTRNIAKGD